MLATISPFNHSSPIQFLNTSRTTYIKPLLGHASNIEHHMPKNQASNFNSLRLQTMLANLSTSILT
jgi:hypothetical protein